MAGTGYTLLSAVLAGRFMRNGEGASPQNPAVTILKPLYRSEPEPQTMCREF